MSLIKQSRCLTCERLKRHTDIVTSRDANKHQQNFPDHHVQIIDEPAEPRVVKRLAPALIIPKPLGECSGVIAYVTSDLYEGPLEARLAFPQEDCDVIWPASHDSDGFYSVTE